MDNLSVPAQRSLNPFLLESREIAVDYLLKTAQMFQIIFWGGWILFDVFNIGDKGLSPSKTI